MRVKKIEHRSKVKVTEKKKTTIWTITFEPEVFASRDVKENVQFLHLHWTDYYKDSSALCPVRVIKNRRQIKHTIFAYFLLNLVNFVPIDLKIGTHIDWTYNMYHTKNCTNKNNITRISMATKYPLIKDRPISDTHNVHFRDGRRLISLVVNLLNCQIYIMQTVPILTQTINECQ